jgi:hypothetical protein
MLYKKGEIVGCSIYSTPLELRNNIKIYNKACFGILIEIIDYNTNIIYNEYNVITGCGNNNSPVLITIKPITINYKLLDSITVNSHNIYKACIDIRINDEMEKIQTLKNINNMSNYYRQKKLENILNNKK